jgi:hypothetical protein
LFDPAASPTYTAAAPKRIMFEQVARYDPLTGNYTDHFMKVESQDFVSLLNYMDGIVDGDPSQVCAANSVCFYRLDSRPPNALAPNITVVSVVSSGIGDSFSRNVTVVIETMGSIFQDISMLMVDGINEVKAVAVEGGAWEAWTTVSVGEALGVPPFTSLTYPVRLKRSPATHLTVSFQVWGQPTQPLLVTANCMFQGPTPQFNEALDRVKSAQKPLVAVLVPTHYTFQTWVRVPAATV